MRIVCVPARPCARSVTVRDFVQAQGFLSPQPISGAPATFWSSAAVDKSLIFLRYRFKAYLSSAAVKKSLRFLRYRFQVFLSWRVFVVCVLFFP